MHSALFSLRRGLLLAVLLLAGLLTPSRSMADDTADQQDRAVTQLVCEILRQGHLSRPQLNDDVSRRLLSRYLKTLDPAKLYFTRADIEEFKKVETELDDQLQKGDVSFSREVHARFLARLVERVNLVEGLIGAEHDFTAKETIDTDYDKLSWAASEEELKERWRKRVKFDLLLHRIGAKPVPEAEAKKKVLTRYQSVAKRYKQMDHFDVLELYLTALTTSLDPHTDYISPSSLDDFFISIRVNLEGIGARLRSENGETTVAEVVPGGPAALDGRLKSNDKIIGVVQGDDKFVDAIDMKLPDVVKLIRGARGTKVQLRVVPAGKIEPVVYELTRQKIELKEQEARGEVIEQGRKADGNPYTIGVVTLPAFYGDSREGKSATEDVRAILKDFKAKKVDGVILDLRDNGGGLLNEAVSLTGLFIDQGPVVQVKAGPGRVQQLKDPERGMAYDGPLMVLTSRLSASAFEILAGAMQDYGRAVVVGDSSTFGKGTVQQVLELGPQVKPDDPPKIGGLKLTMQQFYRVNGDSTQSRGVTPDVVLPSLIEHLATSEKELDHAVPFDQIRPATHDSLGMVTAEVKSALQSRSAERIKKSADYTKLAREIDKAKERKTRKSLSLNEQELKAQFGQDGPDKDEELLTPKKKETAFNAKGNFQNMEALQILEDFLQGKKLVGSR